MSRIGRKESLRLLEIAHEAGINHFDTARLYGYGEAESVLGDFIAGRRDSIIVATKFGIEPPSASPLLKTAKLAARAVVKVFPPMRRVLRRRAEGMVSAGRFDLPTATRSLETSLRQLRTDYIDIFMMHECQPQDVTPEIEDFLKSSQERGLIRRYGIATTRDAVRTILQQSPRVTDVIQFPYNVITHGALGAAQPHPIRDGGLMIYHSVLGAPFLEVAGAFKERPNLRQRWSERLQIDCGDTSQLAKLFLAASLLANPGGAVVFTSTKEANIRANSAVRAESVSPEQVAALRGLPSDIQSKG